MTKNRQVSVVLDSEDFPGRPDHPDFWKLSNAILLLDGEITEGGQTIEEVYKKLDLPDLECVLYMSTQRAARSVSIGLRAIVADLQQGNLEAAVSKMYVQQAGMWTDSFTCGYLLGREDGRNESS